ncbi:MAG: FHA domain-containing protein [Deltaproteobacteria bacterium]|nr:FHA domain-containing protein [Deltaproteobacteria bacterium]
MQTLDSARALARQDGRDALRRWIRSPVLVGVEIRGGEIRRRKVLPPLPETTRRAAAPRTVRGVAPPVAANSVFADTMMHLEEVDPFAPCQPEPEMMASRPMSAPRFVELRRDPRRASPWLIIGRSHEADILINDFTISGRHAAFMVHPQTGDFFLQDGGSTNGTTVRDRPLERGVSSQVLSGDRISFGRIVFVLLDPDDFYELLVGERGGALARAASGR